MNPRYYQSDAEQAIAGAIANGVRRMVCVQATGTGKTVLGAHVAVERLKSGRVMWLCHRDELARQAFAKLKHITGITPAVEKAQERVENEEGILGYSRVIVSSIQTQSASGYARMRKFNPADFALVVLDEFHHSRAETWAKVADHYTQNPQCVLLGLTATPDRADKKVLHAELVYEYPMFDPKTGRGAVHDGYLVPIVAVSCRINGLNLSKVHRSKSATGLNERETEEVMLGEKNLHGVAHATIETAYGLPLHTLNADELEKLAPMIEGKRPKPTLLFATGVAHAHRLAEIINRWIPDSARAVDGTTNIDERRQIVQDYREQKFPFLCNCGVFTEGTDFPFVALGVGARPTTSRSLFLQMIGRITRPEESLADQLRPLASAADANRAMILSSGKPNAVWLDFVGNFGKHDLMTAARAFCDATAAQIVNAGEEPIDLLPAVAQAQELVDRAKAAAILVEANRKTWAAQDEADAAQPIETNDADELAAVKRRSAVLATANYTVQTFDPLGRSRQQIDDNGDGYHGGLSPEMVDRLRAMDVTPEHIGRIHNERQGWAILSSLRKKRCTNKQANYLRRLGVPDHEIGSMNFKVASQRIQELKGAKV